jgi:hypothetical protein
MKSQHNAQSIVFPIQGAIPQTKASKTKQPARKNQASFPPSARGRLFSWSECTPIPSSKLSVSEDISETGRVSSIWAAIESLEQEILLVDVD